MFLHGAVAMKDLLHDMVRKNTKVFHLVRPARCATAFPIAATLLGLPLFFKGALPMDNPLTAELLEMTRMVPMGCPMVPRILPRKNPVEQHGLPSVGRRRAIGAGPGIDLERVGGAGFVFVTTPERIDAVKAVEWAGFATFPNPAPTP